MENPTINPTIEHMDIVERIANFRRGIAEMLGNAMKRKSCFEAGNVRRSYNEGREDAFLFALQMMDIWLPKND